MEVNNEVNKVTDLNTRGCCFLCLESNGIKDEEKQLFSIQTLLQHLQIKSLDEQKFNDEIRVDLCEKCETILNGFILAFEELDKAKMKVNYFLQKINNSISGTGTDSSMQDTKRMATDSKAPTQFEFMDNLRKKIETKCLELQSGLIPSVKIRMAEVIPSQTNEEPCNDEEEDPSPLEDLDDHNFEAPESVEVILPSPEQEQDNFEEEVNPTVVEHHSTGNSKSQGGEVYRCAKCEQTFREKSTLTSHYQRVHLKKQFKCDVCNIAVYNNSNSLATHKKTCGKSLEERLEKEEEMKKINFKCNLCGKTFGSRRVLTNHRLDVHKNINRFPCDLCSKKFSKLCNLKEHKDVVHFGKVYHCRFCYTQLRSRTGVGSHERICKLKPS